MEGDNSFKRRVCAVLLVDVTGFSALIGEDDERTARAVQHLQDLSREVVARFDGQAEPLAGDSIRCTFESVTAAFNAALALLRTVSLGDFEGLPVQVRMGIHVGDVLVRGDAAYGDAINVAARLQALAEPDTICVSDSVYRHVRNHKGVHFVDLGKQTLKNISGPVHAYLAVPPEGSLNRRRWKRSTLAGAAAAAALLVGLALLSLLSNAPPQPPAPPASTRAAGPVQQTETPAAVVDGAPVALGVMRFRARLGVAADDWRADAIRDGLNAQLAQLENVKVYSKEFLDFLVAKKGLTEIEAATELGIRKMLSGSFSVVGGRLHVETHVVDVGTGVFESSSSVFETEHEFSLLQGKLVMGVIAQLKLPVSEEEKQMLLAQQRTNAEALKALLEAEGAAVKPPARPPAPAEPRSSIDRWMHVLALGAPVLAEGSAQEEIRALLERYRRAMEQKAFDEIAAVHTGFTPELRQAQERYFENVRDLKVSFDNIDIAVVGDEAVASYTRTDDFADVRTGRKMHAAVRLTKMLRREPDGWRLTPSK